MLKIRSYAKINLFLELTGKLQNGYHTVDTVMQSISLFDELELELIEEQHGIVIECDDPGIPIDSKNIAYKAAIAFLAEFSLKAGVFIRIKKKIPSAAGMGGGSSNGAAVLVALNKLLNLNVSDEYLCTIAARLGADVPFFIKGGTWRLDGIGTNFREKLKVPDIHIVIVKPNEGVSTPQAYAVLDSIHNDFVGHAPEDPGKLLRALEKSGSMLDQNACFNRFEDILDPLCPRSHLVLRYLRNISRVALLSGSGSAIFAIADTQQEAIEIKNKISEEFPDCFSEVAQTTSMGYEIVS